jgi:hypothetical protein
MAYVKSTFEMNIGLGNNPMDFDQITRHFELNPEFGAFFFGLGQSTYEGKQEPTVHIIMHNTLRYSYFIQRVEALCKLMKQDCIAVKINGQGVLVYNPDYEGSLHTFDPSLWLDKTAETII